MVSTFKADLWLNILFGAIYYFFFAASVVLMSYLIDALIDIEN